MPGLAREISVVPSRAPCRSAANARGARAERSGCAILPTGLGVPFRRVSIVESLSLEPWVVATPRLVHRLAARPLGFRRDELRWFDPMRLSSTAFLDRLERLDELTFGPHGLRMPRWAFYDCVELPGALFGYAGSTRRFPEHVRGALPDDGELWPLSMCMATPMVRPDEWLVFSISSLLELEPGTDSVRLGVETLALTLAALGPKRAFGTMQWSSPSLAAHAHFAPLAVRATWVPAHTHAGTCVFAFEPDAGRIEHALHAPLSTAGEGVVVDPEDQLALTAMQGRIEAGEKLSLVGATEATREAKARVRWGRA